MKSDTVSNTATAASTDLIEESKNEQSIDCPLGFSTLNLDLFKQKILNSQDNLSQIVERSQTKYVSELCDTLDKLSGSRTFCWKLFLGLLPFKADSVQDQKTKWVMVTQEKRALFYKKMSAVLRYKELQEKHHRDVEDLLSLQL